MLWERFLIEGGKGSKKWPSRSLKGGFSLRRRCIFHFFALAWKRHQKGRQKLSKWVPGPQSSGPRACIKWLLAMPARVSWVSTFFTKKWKTVDLHKTLAGIVQTHHRPSWKILFWLPLELFPKIGDAFAMRNGSQRRRNHHKSQKTHSRKGLRPPFGVRGSFLEWFWYQKGAKITKSASKWSQKGAKMTPNCSQSH